MRYLLVASVLVLGCNRSGTRPDAQLSDLAPTPDGRADSSPADGPAAEGQGDILVWPDSGVNRDLTLPACNGKGPGAQDCHARLFIDSARCSPAQPCERLVVYWSGGEQSCVDGTYDGLMQSYAAEGFVAACAQPFSTSAEAGAYPYYQEFDRMDELMAALRALPEVQAAWTGNRLLIAGVSHGATAPLAAIAAKAALRSHAAVWTGKQATAVVLYDGISNTATLEEWTASQQNCAQWHSRFVGRYGDGAPLLHSCSNKACYCSGPAHAADWAADTTALGSTYPKSPYTCVDVTPQSGTVLYRFVSCSGGSAAPCGALGDIIPDDQQKLAHDGLASCAGVVASYKQYPACAHTLCGSKLCGFNDTLTWLSSQGF